MPAKTTKTRQLATITAELERRRDEEKLRFYRPTPKQKEFHLTQKRIAFFLGGNRTGKTVGGACRAILYALGDRAIPYLADWDPSLRQEYERIYKRFGGGKSHGWVVSVTFEVQRDVAQPEVLNWLPRREIKHISNRSKDIIDTITLVNGSTIGFKSADQGREKFQGTSRHWIWFDEEPPQDVYQECQMRVMDVRGDMFGTLTPLQGLTFVYDSIYLNDTKPPETRDPEVFCLTAAWDDNPYLSDDEKQRLEATMDENELEARKYGRFIMPGKCVFDAGAVQEGLAKAKNGERGNLVWTSEHKGKVNWLPDPNGEYEVWHKPQKDTEYLMAADVAEGLEHGDYDALGVLDRDNLRLAAVYHGHCDPDVFADVIHRLAVWYGSPTVAPEANNHGLTTISHLKIEYSDIYRSMVYDKTADEEREKLGWHTTPKTRPLLVDAIKRAVRERYVDIPWRRFWDEAMNFVRHPNGKEAAREGYWDDGVIMMGILMHVHNTTAMTKNMPAPFTPGGTRKRAGWQKDAQGREIFIHPSRLEEMEKEEWGEDGW